MRLLTAVSQVRALFRALFGKTDNGDIAKR